MFVYSLVIHIENNQEGYYRKKPGKPGIFNKSKNKIIVKIRNKILNIR